MFILLSLVYCLSGIQAAPTTTATHYSENFNTFLANSNPSASVCACPNQRSTWDIVWGCLATLFACSWVSIHPNMPAMGTKGWRVALMRLKIMTWTVVAPEMIIFWAARQWLGARKIEKEYKARGWTNTHGHFLQMGGFMLHDGTAKIGVLSPVRFRELLKNDEIEFPTVTEEEIHSRAKGDALSKTLVVAQTIWFIVQCIARRVQGLDTTELELVTLAFASLNGFMYYFWWNKPLDAQLPVPVQLLKPTVKDTHPPDAMDIPDTRSIAAHIMHSPLDSTPKDQIPLVKQYLLRMFDLIVTIFYRLPKAAYHAIDDWMDHLSRTSPSSINKFGDDAMCAPTFYAQRLSDREDQFLAMPACVIGMIFGAIHCAGWRFNFPSPAESILWQTSSLIITVGPFGMLVLTILAAADVIPFKCYGRVKAVVDIITDGIALLVGFVVIPAYLIARIALLAEAFVTLRDISASAQMVVEWTSFIPHI